MRLIDADALRVNVDAAYDSYEYECRTDFYKVMDDAPAIDAIPVEWLEKQADYARSEWDYDTCEGIRIVLKSWQKEQEAR